MFGFIKYYLKILNLFKKYLGNRIFIIYFLVLISSIFESIGIVMIIPFISKLGENNLSTEGNLINSIITKIITFVGFNDSISSILIFILLAFIAKGIILFGSLALSAFLKSRLLYNLKISAFNSINKQKYINFIEEDTGNILNVINEQTNRTLEALKFFIQTGSQFIIVSVYLLTAALINLNFFILSLLTGLFITLIFNKTNTYIRNQSRKISYENGNLSKFLIQAIQSLKYLRSTNQENYTKSKIKASTSKLVTYQINASLAQAFIVSIKEPISVLFVLLIVFTQLIIREKEVTSILVAILLFYRATNGILSIQGWWANTLEYIGSIEIVDNELEKYRLNQESIGGYKFNSLKKKIELDSINFKYKNEQKKILNNLSMLIDANTSIAIVGDSGAGKSTLVDIITLCLDPINGSIFIDNKNGKEIDKSSWRNKIGYVTQDMNLFNESIASNISMTNIDRTQNNSKLMRKIIKSAKSANIHDFISELKDGYHTSIGEKGIKLSGGQKQRIGIARELYREPLLLILDEATSSLDSKSESEIKKSIESLKGKMTIIIIAHRLSTIKNVDNIFVLKNGYICEQGDFNTLKANKKSVFNSYFIEQ